MFGLTGPRDLGCAAWRLLAGALALVSFPAAATGLPLDALLREAQAHNHDLVAARFEVDAAFRRLTQAGLRPNPRLSLGNETDRLCGDAGEYSRSIGITQDFPITVRLARARDVANVDVARALVEVNETERRVLGDISAAYSDVVALDQRIALRGRLIHIDELPVTDSSDRQKAGEVSELDVNTAMFELERLRQERTVLTGQRGAALKTLAGLVGYPPDATPDINTTPPVIAPPLPLGRLTEQALNRRTDLRLLALGSDCAQAEDGSISLGVRQDKLIVGDAHEARAARTVHLSVITTKGDAT